jgi:hypothetical protein
MKEKGDIRKLREKVERGCGAIVASAKNERETKDER